MPNTISCTIYSNCIVCYNFFWVITSSCIFFSLLPIILQAYHMNFLASFILMNIQNFIVYRSPGYVSIFNHIIYPLCSQYGSIDTKGMFLYLPQVMYPQCFQHTILSPEYMCFMHVYTHICFYHQWILRMCFNLLGQTIVGVTNHEFIVAGRGYNCLSQIACMQHFIYNFHISVVNVFCKYTLSHCVSKLVV